MGTGYGPKSFWRKMLRPELFVAKASLWQTAAILWQTAETKTFGSNCFGPNLSLRRDVAALEHSMERRLRPKLPRPELDETKAAVLFDASPYRQDKNCYTFESTHSAAVNGNRVWAKKLLAQDASARTRCGESLSVADGSHSMADSQSAHHSVLLVGRLTLEFILQDFTSLRQLPRPRKAMVGCAPLSR
jgi:hypothetical protein